MKLTEILILYRVQTRKLKKKDKQQTF